MVTSVCGGEPKWGNCGQYGQTGRREWVDSLHVPCRFKPSGTVNRIHWSGKGKGKNHPRTGHESLEGEYRYSSTLSLTSALDGGGGSAPRPYRVTPGKEARYPLCTRLGAPQTRSGQVRKISSPSLGFELLTVKSVASRYSD